MSKCPQCGNKFDFWQLMEHSRRMPLVCEKCKVKLCFKQKDWCIIIILPLVYILAVLVWVCIYKRIQPDHRLYVSAGFLGVGILLVIKFLLRDINSIGLEPKDDSAGLNPLQKKDSIDK